MAKSIPLKPIPFEDCVSRQQTLLVPSFTTGVLEMMEVESECLIPAGHSEGIRDLPCGGSPATNVANCQEVLRRDGRRGRVWKAKTQTVVGYWVLAVDLLVFRIATQLERMIGDDMELVEDMGIVA